MRSIALIPSLLFASLFMAVNFSCGNDNENSKVLAKVGDNYLYASDLGSFHTGSDSVGFVKTFVSKWINDQILLQHAASSQNSTDEINQKVEKYRMDLQLAAYEQEFLRKKLDTTVTQKQLEEFYKTNSALFELRDYVVNVFYMKFDISEKNNSKIAADIKAVKNPEEAKIVENKYASLSVNSYLEPDAWIFLTDLMREIPMEISDKASFLKNNDFYQTNTEEDIYYVRFFDHKFKDETAPLDLVSSKIRSLILQSRAQKLLTDNRNKIIKEFYAKNDVQNLTK